MNIFQLFVVVLLLSACAAEVTILKAVQTLYDRSPKLRIKGAGFDVEDHDIILDISAQGEESLRVEKDFMINKDDDGLILKLLVNRKWVDLEGRTPPVALLLNAVKFASNPDKNLLRDPVILANVLATPQVFETKKVAYMTATNELRINGTGFSGAKKVDLYFEPPIFKEVGYEVVSIKDNGVVLRLRHGYKWREDPGPLSLIGIDTGAGPVKVNGDEGIVVADIQNDLDQHSVAVDASDEQVVYHDEPNVIISGTGFNPQGNSLRFSNGLLGKGINFTTVSTTASQISLRLTPGSFWRKNTENLPGFLTLLAVNAGEGFVAVGPLNAAKGRDIATVFERPQVFSATTKLYRTHSHEFHIMGAGFPKVLSKPQLKFSPPLTENEDYTLTVISRSELEVTLLNGRSWRSEAGDLLVTAINTRGDEAGWVTMPGEGVHVANVVDDIDADSTGGIEVIPMAEKVYQSVLHDQITITGTGFKEGLQFSFDPDLKLDVDYTMDVISKNKILLKLKDGKKWRSEPGFIIAKFLKVDGKKYNLAGTDGIRIAVVLADPTVSPGQDLFHETQSKVIAISGHGFTNVADTKVIIRPSSPGAYKVLAVLEDTIRIQLKPDQDWLPSFLTLKGEDDRKIPLQVTGIDTGPGEITFDEPITIGYIVKDREGVVCDDSCEFAFDGVCDDGTEEESYYENEYYGYYLDDDMGGYYGEGGEGGGNTKEGEEAYYSEMYDDYYMADDGYKVSACVEGTDCTDCGGVDAIIDFSKPLPTDANVESCVNTCPYARDGICDDPRGANYCKLGTDCQDCGPVGADNFTRADDDGWWDDDDDYWTFNDGNFLDQAKGLEANRHRVKVFTKTDSAGPAAMFLVVLEGMVYTVGAIFALAACYIFLRWYRGESIPCVDVFNPDNMANRQSDSSKSRSVPITPDVVRT